MSDVKSRVEIGYLEQSEGFKLESRYFPSKVGGKPAWLDLKNINVDVCCGVCSEQCAFLCQVYAPGEQATAFHRTVYVFVCKNPECCRVNLSDNFVVLRCQLSQKNDFYVEEEPPDDPDWHPESCVSRFKAVCEVCGCFGPYQCSKCKRTKYCTKNHQIMHWKMGHNKNCGDSSESIINTFLFPEFEIITELEEESKNDEEVKIEKSDEVKMKEYEALVSSGKAGTLDEDSLNVLEKFAIKEDKYLKKFKRRLALCPDQVIRYEKGGEPLWVSEPVLVDVPACESCGGPREFEFQILPTLLSYLDVDSLSKSIDWGTLVIYTCKNNCDVGPSYKKEFLWKQDIL